MIAIALIWVYIALLAISFGLASEAIIAKVIAPRDSEPPVPWITALLGGAVLCALLTSLSLVMAMTAVSHLIVLGFASVGLVLSRARIGPALAAFHKSLVPVSVIGLCSLALSIVLVIGSSASYPDHYDSGLYHAQSIRWIDEYPAVPGLGNLHARLAFNSTWHVLESFFGFSFLEPSGFRALNGLLLVAVASLGCMSLAAIVRGDVRPSRLASAMMLASAIYYFQRHIASPLTDTPATLIAWLLWFAVLTRLERGARPGIDRESVALVVIACFLVTVKPSALPTLLVVLIPLGRPWQWDLRQVALLALLCAVITLPWVARGVVLSGTLAFPLSALSPLPVDWAVPRGRIVMEESITRAWARLPGREAAEVLAIAPADWIPTWWSAQSYQTQAMLATLLMGPLVLASLLPRSLELFRAAIRFPGTYAAMVGAGYAGAWLWFATAPDIRFGLGTLIPLTILLIAPPLIVLLLWSPALLRGVVAFMLLVPALSTLGNSLELIARPDRVLRTEGYYGAQTQVRMMNGFPVLAPTVTDQCWNAPLPCTPSLDPGLILRGCTLATGFRLSANPERDRRPDCPPMSSVQGRSRVPEILPIPRIERVVMRRRNQVDGPEVDCDAERQNEIRVLVRNQGTPATEAAVEFVFDDAEIDRQLMATLATGEERWIEVSAPIRPRRGDHVLEIRVVATDDLVDDKVRVEMRCT